MPERVLKVLFKPIESSLCLAVVDEVLDLYEVDEEAHDLRLEHQHHVAHELLQIDIELGSVSYMIGGLQLQCISLF